MLVSELAGKATITEKAAEAGITVPEGERAADFAQRVLDRVKELEHEGFQFEAADGSLELLMRKEAGDYEPLFRLESWRVLVEKRADGKVATEATIKVWLGGERFVRTAEGNGPVNALDAALRDAIGELHPHLRDIELVNFKVRILDESHGTGAVTRVLIDAADGHDVWGTIGVSENVIEASWDALVDSLEYGMQPGRRPAGLPAQSGEEAKPISGPGVTATATIPLARPVLGEREEQAVIEVLRSGQLSLGPRLEAFERAFAEHLGCAWASAVSSGTAGLHLALRSVGVGDGDEVITSPFSFVASANAALYERARPVFADIDPVTLNLDPRGRRGSADAAHARAPTRTHLRLPRRHAGLRGARRKARPGDRRGCLRGARRPPRRRPGDRRPRQPCGVRLLRQQAADDRGGRDGDGRRPGEQAKDRLRAKPGAGPRHGLARS